MAFTFRPNNAAPKPLLRATRLLCGHPSPVDNYLPKGIVHTKDMTTTRPEFFRILDIALSGQNYSITGNNTTLTDGDKTIQMTLSELPRRRLSQTLSMERWLLTMNFSGYDKTGFDNFMKSFDRAFQRGGG